ncbi:hypothetical protein BMB171_C4707 [Bacillus thuringiensis BMB171]|nr:hypothetical protein BMB171_C4707 [Bacillus thuringiensis BMB171]
MKWWIYHFTCGTNKNMLPPVDMMGGNLTKRRILTYFVF